MWPWILGSAALGGLQAYQQSRGDIGKTLTGAAIGGGLGALVPGAGRFAGTALEGTGILTPLAANLTKIATKGRQLAGLAGPVQAIQPAQLAKLAGGGTAMLASTAIPGIAAGLSGAGRSAEAAPGGGAGPLSGPGKAAGVARAVTFQPGELTPPEYQTGAVPGISQYNYPGLVDQQNIVGPWQTNLLYQRQMQDVENQNIMRLSNYQLAAADDVQKRDMQRSAAMAQLKTNLATLSSLQLGAQQAASHQASQALANMGAIAGTQYQY